MARLAIKLFVIALIFSLIGCFSSLGFPYSGNLSSPSAQRHVLHVRVSIREYILNNRELYFPVILGSISPSIGGISPLIRC